MVWITARCLVSGGRCAPEWRSINAQLGSMRVPPVQRFILAGLGDPSCCLPAGESGAMLNGEIPEDGGNADAFR